MLGVLGSKIFAASCTGILTKQHGLIRDDMVKLFKKQAAVMTVRGSSRDEYLASMELSRF
jgi:hypothetical protein